jgi:putative ABC transport system ATP-binding protein
MTLKQPIIAIQNLNHSLGKGLLNKQIISDINLLIYPGDFVILTGPSGSGKTTLLTLISGLRSVQEGSLKVFNQELYRASNHQLVKVRRNIGYIFQKHNLLPFLTAVQNVQTSILLHKEVSVAEAYARSVAMLKAVGLGQYLDYYPRKLSGGQQQRVAIARALVTNPKLIVADEPTAALDKQTGHEVVELMQRLSSQFDSAVLLVTHDNRILDFADRIIYMEDGRLVNTNISQIRKMIAPVNE